MKVLLTGATGFLGSALAKYWMQAGHELTLLVRPSSRLQRIESLLPNVLVVTCHEGSDLKKIVQIASPDCVVHTACSYGRLGEPALQIFDTNVRLGMLLIDAVLAAGKAPTCFINTATSLDSLAGNYALSKSQFSQWGDALARQNSDTLQFLNIRLQHMYGPGDDQSKFSSYVLHACHNNQTELALTAGEQQRDFIYIDDAVSAYDFILNNQGQFSTSDRVDVGSGDAPTVRKFVERVHSMLGSKTNLRFGAIPYRENEAMLCKADITRLRGLGWKPTYDLCRGIRKTIELEFGICDC
ncbi:MAG TPA: NAD(P)-dependent oxidoreductase [Nitrosomonas sp.]|nr:NAD(P)-dependent oxidoreductase [Nitrosomonas sp.]